MKWFDNPQTLEELKKQYKRLAMIHHPDRGGTTKDMQEINSEYDQLFQRLKNVHTAANGTTYTTGGETTEKAEDFREIINILIRFEGLHIEICGTWLWISGDTKPHRDDLKKLRFRWSQSKKAWYYHTSPYRKHSSKTLTLDEIRSLYGSEVVRNSPTQYMQVV
jgi:curved DNA-binding protein CbpA